ncbi:hypothetical protein [Bradyrhizobium sp. Tv2a-2]|uniref:hypothetical protein n=1 Tax=Bradyrhizobium sp. Tv2a-2 TaxID=113395 RepID=UPI00040E671A|nr:hypothetical protein [Bradyrhizobium sp. Tv2a-2]
MPKIIKELPSTVTEVDADGRATIKPMSWKLVPPPKDHCLVCARKHPPEDPHDVQQIYYQTCFQAMVGRPATWADAMAHCSDKIKRVWTEVLHKTGHWSEPPNGEAPVKHHGVE